MEPFVHTNGKFKLPKLGKIPWYFIIVSFVFLLAVLQDYIYSIVKQTGFYLSESMLYNTFWIFFIPFTLLINRLIKSVNPKTTWFKLPLFLATGVVFSLSHILLFTALFVSVSHFVFSPPHYFSIIFNAAFSNQFYIAVLWYTIFPVIYNSWYRTPKNAPLYPEKTKLRIGTKIISIPTTSIQLIFTDKPYAMVCTHDQKFLDNRSLKEFETTLDPKIFIRVHRSAIINTACIKELKSRSNGDYDATLENGELVRLSRHYRSNWQNLLQ